jgi:hypothetical protein
MPRESSNIITRRATYHDLGVVRQTAVAHSNESVVLFTFSKSGAVDVSRKPADGSEDTGVEGGLEWPRCSQHLLRGEISGVRDLLEMPVVLFISGW